MLLRKRLDGHKLKIFKPKRVGEAKCQRSGRYEIDYLSNILVRITGKHACIAARNMRVDATAERVRVLIFKFTEDVSRERIWKIKNK